MTAVCVCARMDFVENEIFINIWRYKKYAYICTYIYTCIVTIYLIAYQCSCSKCISAMCRKDAAAKYHDISLTEICICMWVYVKVFLCVCVCVGRYSNTWLLMKLCVKAFSKGKNKIKCPYCQPPPTVTLQTTNVLLIRVYVSMYVFAWICIYLPYNVISCGTSN